MLVLVKAWSSSSALIRCTLGGPPLCLTIRLGVDPSQSGHKGMRSWNEAGVSVVKGLWGVKTLMPGGGSLCVNASRLMFMQWHAVSARFGCTEDAVIIVGAGIAGLSAAAALHKVRKCCFVPLSAQYLAHQSPSGLYRLALGAEEPQDTKGVKP